MCPFITPINHIILVMKDAVQVDKAAATKALMAKVGTAELVGSQVKMASEARKARSEAKKQKIKQGQIADAAAIRSARGPAKSRAYTPGRSKPGRRGLML